MIPKINRGRDIAPHYVKSTCTDLVTAILFP